MKRVLVVSLDAYRFSTRSRKAAIQYRSVATTTFLGLSGAGRTGRWDKPGAFHADGLSVRQVYVRRPWVAPTRLSQIRNVLFSYCPAFIRLASVVVATPADVVHVTGSPLAMLGLLHRARFGSRMVLDIQERPGVVAAKGSVTALFSRIESLVLRHVSKRAALATVVTYADVSAVAEFGFHKVLLVRNAPLLTWRAPYKPPAEPGRGDLIAVVLGSIFEGRGYETLLRAIAKIKHQRRVRLKIYGSGRESYITSLRGLAKALNITNLVEWMGAIASSEVSSAYLSAQVGIVLYEPIHLGNDGLSNKILECVSSGRPVIAGDQPENRRFVTEHGVGWLTEVTVEGVAAALENVGADGPLALISSVCRQHGDSWLNWEAEFAKVLGVLKGELGHEPP